MSIIVGNVARCRRVVGTLLEFIADTCRHRDRKLILPIMSHNTTSPFSRSGPGAITSIDRGSGVPNVYQTMLARLRVVLSAARKTVAV